MKNIVIIICFTLFLSSCGGNKTSSYEDMMKDAPEWVRRTPNVPGFYHGVGTTSKASSTDFRERAQQSALSELANSISVNISSSSVLNSFQNNSSYNEYYRTNSKVTSQEFLEGYELVDTWENKNQFWVYYRLSRFKYEQIKQDRIDRALNSSISKYEQAKNLSNSGQGFDAFRFYVLAIEDVSDFLGEDLKFNVNGVERPYSTQLMNDFIAQIKNMRIVYPNSKGSMKQGENNNQITVEATVLDQNRKPVSGIPVETRMSWSPGTVIENVSDVDGIIRINPRRIDSRKKTEQITSVININKMVRTNTSNMMVLKFLEGVKIDNYVYNIDIVPPVFNMSVVNGEDNKSVKSFILQDEFARLTRDDGFEMTSNPNNADFVLSITITTNNTNQINGRFSHSLTGSFSVRDNSSRTLYSTTERNISGIGMSAVEAEEDALKSLAGKLRIGIYSDIKKAIF
jgi:hypothetical protein